MPRKKPLQKATRSPYATHDLAYWDEVFVAEYHRLRPTGQDDYNRRRDPSHPSWTTLARMHGLATWRQLLACLELEKCKRPRRPSPPLRVRIR